MYDLAVACTVGFYQDIAVYPRFSVFRQEVQIGPIRIYQVKLPVPAFDPVVTNNRSCGTVFQVISQAIFT
jgi:hypothetical protein